MYARKYQICAEIVQGAKPLTYNINEDVIKHWAWLFKIPFMCLILDLLMTLKQNLTEPRANPIELFTTVIYEFS